MEPISMFAAFYNWALSTETAKAVGLTILGRGSYDALTSLKDSFWGKMKQFFGSNSEAQQYMQAICEKQAINSKKPYRDIEDIFEEMTSLKTDDTLIQQFLSEMKTWMIENSDQIRELGNSQRQIITSQKAGRDINNVQGTQINFNR